MLRRQLAAKIIFYIAIVLILTLGIFMVKTINFQKEYLIKEILQDGVRLSQTIERSIDDDMLTARNENVQKTLEDIGKQEDIEQIRIFDKEGKIIAADSSEAIGMLIDRREEACFVCHGVGEPLKKQLSISDQARIFRLENGNRVLGIINPLYNEPRCYSSACHFHPSDQSVLGVMDILISLDRFDDQIRASRRQIIIYFLATFLIISAGISLFIFLFVSTPIRKLRAGTRKISEGDLTYRIGSHYSDEIGELGKSFDQMAAELMKSHEEIVQWNLKLKDEVKKATEKLSRTNEELTQANTKLQELDSLKSDFMRKMEHGSRSHLAVMQSCLSLVLGEYYSDLNEQQKDLISTARRRCSTLLEVLDDILLLSYRKSIDAAYNMGPVRLAEILLDVVEDTKIQAQEKNIRIDIQVPLDFSPVLADPEALKEVFSNLINNAVKYTKEDGSIDVTAKQNEDSIEIIVSDTGIGIASEDLPNIFEEFYRASNAKSFKIEGSGVGLAIVKEIIDAHGGSIKVESELGKGTTITIILPRAEPEG
jgi:two-component system NtrC family sensor kinase